MKEVWLEINGYPDYKVSNMGRVKSYKKDAKNGVLLKPCRSSSTTLFEEDKYGTYLRVELRNDLGERSFKVHRLVAMAFIPNPDNLPQVNHKNGIKSDNRVENLEWCSSFENVFHSSNVLHKDLYGKSRTILALKEHVNKKEKGVRKEYKRKRIYATLDKTGDLDISDKENIVMLSKFGEIISTFKTPLDACRYLSIPYTDAILRCCKKRKTLQFLQWLYMEICKRLE